jgi:hypothetical protein
MDEFQQAENPTYDQIIAAYVERDTLVNIDLNEESFSHAIKKLKYSIHEDDIRKEFTNLKRYRIDKAIRENDQDTLNEMITFTYSDYYQQKYQHKLTKYNHIKSAFDTGDKETFYRAFTKKELEWLGY